MVSDYKITMEQAETEMACYRKVFDDVRLYDEAAVDALKKEDECGRGCFLQKRRVIQAGVHR